ncbi:hypothetical protein SUDANB95_07934 (plasmid) [Actinosynnema sp. ALI-1.44]
MTTSPHRTTDPAMSMILPLKDFLPGPREPEKVAPTWPEVDLDDHPGVLTEPGGSFDACASEHAEAEVDLDPKNPPWDTIPEEQRAYWKPPPLEVMAQVLERLRHL